MNRFTPLFFGFFLLLGGCASKENFIVLMPGSDGSTGAITIETHQGSVTLDEPGKGIYIESEDAMPSQPTVIEPALADVAFSQALAVHPLMPQSFLLYFDLNSNQLTPPSQELLPRIKAAAEGRAYVDISIIGHTDRTGTDEYNERLSLQRAQTVFSLLKEAGIAEEGMSISYYGEANPLVPTADNIAEPKNRRVEVLVR